MASTHAWPIALCKKMNKNPNYGYILLQQIIFRNPVEAGSSSRSFRSTAGN
jgi:hypothetical protein